MAQRWNKSLDFACLSHHYPFCCDCNKGWKTKKPILISKLEIEDDSQTDYELSCREDSKKNEREKRELGSPLSHEELVGTCS